jgi:hypothetical protein
MEALRLPSKRESHFALRRAGSMLRPPGFDQGDVIQSEAILLWQRERRDAVAALIQDIAAILPG